MPRRRVALAGAKGIKAMVPQELVGLILAAIALVTASTVIYNFGPFLFGGGTEQTATDSFNSLGAELARLAAKSEPYATVEKFPYTMSDGKYYLIGFDTGGQGIKTKGAGCLGARKKPVECASKACICIYDSSMNPTPGESAEEQAKGLKLCKKIGWVSTISSIKEARQGGSDISGRTETTYGNNLGAIRENIHEIKGLAAELQATDYLFMMHGDLTNCGESLLYQQSVSSLYKNGPLYLERITINGASHITVSPASEASSKRMKELRALLGITIPTVQAKLDSGDLTGTIIDSKTWLEKRAGTNTKPIETATMLILQSKAFQKMSEIGYRDAGILLEKLAITTPNPDQADKTAGLYAVKSYKATNEYVKRSADTTVSMQDLQSRAVLGGLDLSQKLQNYFPEIKDNLLPYFLKEAESVKGASLPAAFLRAKQAAEKNDPEAIKLLTEFAQGSPDNDQSREARFILAGLQEKKGLVRDALSTYQQAKLRFTPAEQTMSDGRRLTADDEINRICTDKLAEADIFDICSQVKPGTTCPTPTLAVLPKEACTQNLLDEKRCVADPDVVFAFQKAQEIAMRSGKTLEITSAYRTIERQQALFDAHKNGMGPPAAAPSCAAPHVTGRALDVRFRGEDMGREGLSDMGNTNRKQLEAVMCQAGFVRWTEEYWHYEIGSKRASEHRAEYPTACSAP